MRVPARHFFGLSRVEETTPDLFNTTTSNQRLLVVVRSGLYRSDLKKYHCINEGVTMKKPFTAIAIFLFTLMAIGHLLRAMTSAEIIIAGISIPVFVSWPAAVIAGFIAYMLWRETKEDG